MELFSNPELIRNARAQLRAGRMVGVAGICAAVSLTIGYAYWSSDAQDWGTTYLLTMLTIQILTLAVGGSMACMQSVSREKELNTFDFQRVTRLTPLELAFGKLFGAPIQTYFIFLCLLPATIFAAVVAGTRPSFFLAALATVLVGSLTYHAFSLMISMLLARGLSVGGALVILYFIGMGSIPDFGEISIGRVSPFFALDLVRLTSWRESTYEGARLIDSFFGLRIHHFLMLLLVNMAFTVWFLLALSRNLKRDPSTYELFNARQSFGLLLFVNFLFVGFYRWEGKPPLDSQAMLLAINVGLLFVLGLALILNRDQARRQMRRSGEMAPDGLASAWPAPYILIGIAVIGLLGSGMYASNPVKGAWNWPLALFRILFLGLWISRDVLYLQWVNLTRIKRPLMMGFVYLLVFYMCSTILLAVFSRPGNHWLAGALLPATVLELNLDAWRGSAPAWVVILLLHAALCGLFIFLQRERLLEIVKVRSQDVPTQ